MRLDKWLWAARFFKTRGIATRACELGRVELGGQRVKPSRDLRAGDVVTVRNETAIFVVEVLVLSEMRGPASVAQTLYRETDESKVARAKAIEAKKLMPVLDVLTEGRPSKRDRRNLNRLRAGRA